MVIACRLWKRDQLRFPLTMEEDLRPGQGDTFSIQFLTGAVT